MKDNELINSEIKNENIILIEENNYECCICLNKIEEDVIKCKRCNNNICIECFGKMDKSVKIINNNINTSYNCPICRLEEDIELINADNIKKYKLEHYIKEYISCLNNNLVNMQISNNILNHKNEYLSYYTKNFYNMLRLLYIIDKGIIFIIGLGIYFIFT
tara:strand:+ start:2574 stop:3056 length:483 start_codon:yes stop_codon:yes gene_type:complete